MLQRTIVRPLIQHGSSPTALTPCISCTCACGNTFRRQHVIQQKRAASGRKAPSTYRKVRREQSYALTPTQAKRRKEVLDNDRNQHYNTIRVLQSRHRELVMTPDTGTEFMADFGELAKSAKGKNAVDVAKFDRLVLEYGLPKGEVFFLAGILLQKEDDKILGKKLLFTMSASGFEEATIRICNHALLGNKMQPHLLRASEINYERGRLRDIARIGTNFRAMVLEGKIALALGNEEYAIEMWDQAMSAAVAQSEMEAAMRAQNRLKELGAQMHNQRRDLSELSSPWIDVTLIRYERYLRFYDRNDITLALAEFEKAREAMKTGCRMDDPTSHYHAAEFFKEINEDGSTRHTSSWLYHMTKAAATGHAMAAHALAVFYAETGWKYIEDEPPDHMKPTPFDSYPPPADGGLAANAAAFVPTLRLMFGYDNSVTSTAEATTASSARDSDQMFASAIFPGTPTARWAMAYRWLEPALKRNYAPSYLYAAKMLLQKTLWAQAQAPDSAMNMTDERYTYASKEDYEAGNPIAPPNEQVTTEATDVDPPNLGYDEDLAKSFLTQIFYAYYAHQLRQNIMAETQRRVRKRQITGVVEVDDASDPDQIHGGIPETVKKWLRDPDVREMYEHQIHDLEAEARRICDDHGWDLHDEDGGLLYKCGLGKVIDTPDAYRYVGIVGPSAFRAAG